MAKNKNKSQSKAASKKYNIEWVSVESLTPYKDNARINDQTVPYLINSIKRFGFKVPLVIDKDGVIICGHTRLKAALELGMAEVPCIRAGDLSDDEVKAFRLVDNKVQEISSWDFEKLDIELGSISDSFNGLTDFGFSLFGDKGELPPELAGKDLTPDKLPDAGGEAQTASRIIISFEEDQRQVLADILGVKELPKDDISYHLSKILKMRAANGHADSVPVSHDDDGNPIDGAQE